MKIWGKLIKFKRLSWHEKVLFSEAFFLQIAIGLLLNFIPFKRIPELFSNPQLGTQNSELGTSIPESGTIIRIKSAVQRASIFSPWKNKCLVQSLAARRMLTRRKIPSQLCFGVKLGENSKMIAHAWIKSGDFEIVEKRSDYPELYTF